MNFFKSNFLLILIISFSIVLRFINLSTTPVGFNDDEAAFAFNAYSILKTGKDEWGRLLPFPTFESFGDWKLVGYLYPVVISQSIFGANEFATRLPSALFGVFAVFSTYLLSKKLFENKNIALMSALFLAISPWHIAASRNAFESDILIFFITLSVYFFLTGLNNVKYLKFSTLGFIIAFYIYRSAWFFVPFLILSLLYANRNLATRIKADIAKNLVIIIIFLLPLLPTITTFRGQSRFFQESFITGVQKIGIINEINQRRGLCQKELPKFLCPIVYNKYNFFFSTYLNNYFSNLSPETYYIKSNPTGYQAFPLRGFFFTFELPLLAIGLFFLIKNKHKATPILLVWILIVPLGPSLTGVGNPGRLNILMPVTQIIAAFGLMSIYSFFTSRNIKRLLTIIVSVVIVFSVLRLSIDSISYYPQISARYQRYGYKQLFDYLESRKEEYNQIAVSRKTDDAKQYIHYLFFEKYDPGNYQKSVKRYKDEGGWQVVEQIGNFRFYPTTPSLENLPKRTILAVGEKEVSFPTKPIFTVIDLRGDLLFEVYDVDEVKEKLRKINE